MILIIYFSISILLGLFTTSIWYFVFWNSIFSFYLLQKITKQKGWVKRVTALPNAFYVQVFFICAVGCIGWSFFQRLLTQWVVAPKLSFMSFELFGYFIYTLIMAPILEEFLMRQYVFLKLVKKHRLFAYLCSALLFAILHGNLIQAIPALFMGLFFAYVYDFTKQLWCVILLHMFYNLLILGSGLIPYSSFGLICCLIVFFVLCFRLCIKYKPYYEQWL